VGSACKGCTTQSKEGGDGMLAFAGTGNVVAASCPLGPTGAPSQVHIAGFNLATLAHGLELSWITTGDTVESFRIYRRAPDGGEELVAEGKAASGRLMRVELPASQGQAATDLYTVVVVDRLGWETHVSSDGKSERRPRRSAPAAALSLWKAG
jgi:hypothetical protein